MVPFSAVSTLRYLKVISLLTCPCTLLKLITLLLFPFTLNFLLLHNLLNSDSIVWSFSLEIWHQCCVITKQQLTHLRGLPHSLQTVYLPHTLRLLYVIAIFSWCLHHLWIPHSMFSTSQYLLLRSSFLSLHNFFTLHGNCITSASCTPCQCPFHCS